MSTGRNASRLFALAFSLLLLPLPVGTARASWKPTKPIQLIVGFAAGGTSDIIARTIANAAQECYSQPLVIINKPGAAGTIAAQEVSRSAPDGHTLLLGGGSESTSVPAHRKVPYDPKTGFTPIIRLTLSGQFIAVNAKSPYKTAKDIIDAAKARPGLVAHGSSGVGSLAHSLALLFARKGDVKFKHVPYQNGPEAVQALLAGQLDFTVTVPDEVQGQVDAGAIRIIGVASEARNPVFPDVPTLKEAGYPVLLENMKGWVGPPQLPPDIVKTHHDCFQRAMSVSAWRDYIARLKEPNGYLDGASFQREMRQLLDEIAAALAENR